MTLRRLVWEGECSPKWYGRAYRLLGQDRTMCYPIPLNWIVGGLRTVYYKLLRGPNDPLVRAWHKGFEMGYSKGEAKGYRQGLEHGHRLAKSTDGESSLATLTKDQS